MTKDEKAALFIIIISLLFVMAIIFTGKERQVVLTYKAGDVLESAYVNINRIKTNNRIKLSNAEKTAKKIILQDAFKNWEDYINEDNNWNQYKQSGQIKKKIEKWENYDLTEDAYNREEYIQPPYRKNYFEDKKFLYLDAIYNSHGKLLNTKILYSPDKRLNSIAKNIIKKVNQIKIPQNLNKNVKIEFMFSERFCNPNVYLNNKLLNAIEKADIKEVKQLLKKGADINTYSAMYKAIDSGNLNMVKFLLNNGFDFSAINQPTYLNSFMFDYSYAARNANFEIFKYLIDYAVKNGFVFDSEIIECLIKSRDIKKIKYFEPLKKPYMLLNKKIKVKKTNKQSSLLKDKRLSLANKPLIDYIKSIRKKQINLVDSFPTLPSQRSEVSVIARINEKGQVISTKVIPSNNKDSDVLIMSKDAEEYIKKLSPFKPIPASYSKSFIDVQFDFVPYNYREKLSIRTNYFINNKFIEAIKNNNTKEAQIFLTKGADINVKYDDIWKRSNAFYYALFYNSDDNIKNKIDFLLNNGYIFKKENDEDISYIMSSEKFKYVKYLIQTIIEYGLDINSIDLDARDFYRIEKALNELGYKYKIIYKNTYIKEFLNKKITSFLRQTINKPYFFNYMMKSYYPSSQSASSVCFGGLPDIFVFCFCMYPIESFNISLDFYKKNSKNWEIDKNLMFNILEYTLVALLERNQSDMSTAVDYMSVEYKSYLEGKLNNTITSSTRIYALQSFFAPRGKFFGILYLYYALKVLEYERLNNPVAKELYQKYGPQIKNKYNVYAINWNNGVIPEDLTFTYYDRDNFISHIDMEHAKSRYKTLPLI